MQSDSNANAAITAHSSDEEMRDEYEVEHN